MIVKCIKSTDEYFTEGKKYEVFIDRPIVPNYFVKNNEGEFIDINNNHYGENWFKDNFETLG